MSLVPSISFACAVCFGNPDSLSSKALLAGVFFLVGVIGTVLASIAWTGFVWAQRAKKIKEEIPS